MYTYTEYNRSITKSQVNKKYNDMPTIFFLSDNLVGKTLAHLTIPLGITMVLK